MVIAYDASVVTGQSGIERYARELIRAVMRKVPPEHVTLVSDSGQGSVLMPELFPGANHRRVMTPESAMPRFFGRALRILRQHQLTHAVQTADIVHLLGPQKIVPKARRLVVTIHDVFPMDTSMEVDPVLARRFPARITKQLRAASAVLTPSAYTAASLREHFPWYQGPTYVTPLAASAAFSPTPLAAATRDRYALHRPYMVFVGREDGRKNLRRILEAWQSLPAAIRNTHTLALIIPASDDALARIRRTYQRAFADGSVTLCANVPLADMVQMLSSAEALVFATLGEGFGLPVIEAMQCGCPVITSNNTALREVGGDAALYVDPRLVDEIAGAMRRCLTDAATTASLREKGIVQSAAFTWDRTASLTLAAYASVIG